MLNMTTRGLKKPKAMPAGPREVLEGRGEEHALLRGALHTLVAALHIAGVQIATARHSFRLHLTHEVAMSIYYITFDYTILHYIILYCLISCYLILYALSPLLSGLRSLTTPFRSLSRIASRLHSLRQGNR